MKTIIHLICSLLLISHASCKEMREVKVTVTEEDGTPIQGARVQISFIGYTSEQSTRSIELTDENGRRQASGTAPLRMKVMVSKDGYYDSVRSGLSKQKNHDVTMILRKIKNPIPLYAKRVNLKIPVNNKWLGYDLKIGDWVKPYGLGKTPDFSLKSDSEITGVRDAKGILKMKFADGGGMQLVKNDYLAYSKLKMPHEALTNNLVALANWNENSYHNKSTKHGVGYFFKCRVKEEADGSYSANYGKFATDIKYDPRWSKSWNITNPETFGTVSLMFYFNPTPNDRNLEFDPTKNLFKDLDSTEVVREP